MNSIQEINRINQRELDLGLTGSASWHHQYSQSAYVHVGGLSYEMTEGDVLTVFSQFGEIMDINMPRDQDSGKPRGFAFLMYEDQRSTVLAVDNMNGALVLGRMLKVDHVHKYEQPGKRDEEGKYQKPEEPTYNAMPPELSGSEDSSGSESDADPAIDAEDPMAAFLRAEKKKNKPKKSKGGEGKEEKKRRKEERRSLREERERKRLIKALKAKEGSRVGGSVASGSRAGEGRRGETRDGRDGEGTNRERRDERTRTRSPKREELSPVPPSRGGRSDGGRSNGVPSGRDVRDERGGRDTYDRRGGREVSPPPRGDRRGYPNDRRRDCIREDSPPRRYANGRDDRRYDPDERYDRPRDRRDDYDRRERR